jgi:hypothetical protein
MPFLAATLPQPTRDRAWAESHASANAKTRERTSLGILKIVTAEIDSSSDNCRAVRAPL